MTPRLRSTLFLLLLLCFGFAGILGAQSTDDVVGDWLGTLATGGIELRIVLHIEAVGETHLTGTMDSPDQGASGIPATRVVFREGRLEVTVPAVAGTYEATLADDGRLEGTWSQGAVELPLILERIDEPIVLHRPQVPSEPYPYDEEEIRGYRTSETPVRYNHFHHASSHT